MLTLFHVYLFNHVQEGLFKMKNLREWLIKKLVGNKPIIMNVTLVVDEPIKGSSSAGMYDKCSISYSEKLQKEMGLHENN